MSKRKRHVWRAWMIRWPNGMLGPHQYWYKQVARRNCDCQYGNDVIHVEIRDLQGKRKARR